MIEIDKPKIEIVDVSTVGSRSTGRFVVEPLERGFGTTLGNGMRRVLLSSLPGYAITSVKIDGVLHEFSTIPHVKEAQPHHHRGGDHRQKDKSGSAHPCENHGERA